MTVGVQSLTVRDVAGLAAEVAQLEAADRTALVEQFVSQLPADLVPLAALRAKALSDLVGDIRKQLDTRMALDGLQEWTDPETKKRYEFTGPSYRICVDPRGLFEEFTRRGIGLADLAGAIAARGLRISDLRRVVGKNRELAAVLAEYFTWKDGPRHLRALDDQGEPEEDDGGR